MTVHSIKFHVVKNVRLGHLFLRVPTPAAFPPGSWLLSSRDGLAHPGSTCDACKGAIRAYPVCPSARYSAACLRADKLGVRGLTRAARRRLAHDLHALRRAPVRGV